MHIFFSGIGGTAIGPLALIAHQAGHEVSGSDKQDSQYLSYLQKQGLGNIHVGQTAEAIKVLHQKHPIDWIVFSSAVLIEHPDHPELLFAKEFGIKYSKRDELLNEIITKTDKKLIAIAGTHGKTTTTAMAIWLFKELDLPVSYSVGAKIPFGEMGDFNEKSEYFVYECDEFDRNFLSFHPYMSIITGIDYDHHEIFPSRADYQAAFRQFLGQSGWNVVWASDVEKNALQTSHNYMVISDHDPILNALSIGGEVNRRNALQVAAAMHELTKINMEELLPKLEAFPGLSRRFEKITENLYTDYAHTPPKIAGCLQLAQEFAKSPSVRGQTSRSSGSVVVVYEPLTNRRQHFIKNDYKDLFAGIKKLYWVPSYLARENPDQAVLSPAELIKYMQNKEIAEPAVLNDQLKENIQRHLQAGDLVVCLSGGGGGSLDEWLRKEFK